MNEEAQAWCAGLKKYAARCRMSLPIIERDGLSQEEEGQCRIIGGSLMTLLQGEELGSILKQRRFFKRMIDFEDEPLLVFTTNMPGLVAAAEILPTPPQRIVYLLHEEFERWDAEHLSREYRWHIHYWSLFRKPDDELLTRAQGKYPQIGPSGLRIHILGNLWGRQMGHEVHHLWHWDGQELVLVEEAFGGCQF